MGTVQRIRGHAVAAVVRVGGGVAVFVGEDFGVAAVEVGDVLLGVGFFDFQKAVDFVVEVAGGAVHGVSDIGDLELLLCRCILS